MVGGMPKMEQKRNLHEIEYLRIILFMNPKDKPRAGSLKNHGGPKDSTCHSCSCGQNMTGVIHHRFPWFLFRSYIETFGWWPNWTALSRSSRCSPFKQRRALWRSHSGMSLYTYVLLNDPWNSLKGVSVICASLLGRVGEGWLLRFERSIQAKATFSVSHGKETLFKQ